MNVIKAVRRQNLTVITFLLERGAGPLSKSEDGCSMLLRAAAGIVEIL